MRKSKAPPAPSPKGAPRGKRKAPKVSEARLKLRRRQAIVAAIVVSLIVVSLVITTVLPYLF